MKKAAHFLKNSEHAIALTGAGISVESGIPDFRSPGGLWERFDPMEYATIEAFRRNPAKVWQMLVEMDALVEAARPNAAHFSLARLEEKGLLKAVVTQNVDSLHQKAGSKNVIEFHGSGKTLSCLSCGSSIRREEVKSIPPPCERCGTILKPDVVFFGEMIPPDALRKAQEEAMACDVMMVIGTSAEVAPASFLPSFAKENNGRIIEVNLVETHLTHTLADTFLRGKAAELLPLLLEMVEEGSPRPG